MAYNLHSIRLHDDVWAALQASPLSANQILREALGLDSQAAIEARRLREQADALTSEPASKSLGADQPKESFVERWTKVIKETPLKTDRKPLLKPSEKKGERETVDALNELKERLGK